MVNAWAVQMDTSEQVLVSDDLTGRGEVNGIAMDEELAQAERLLEEANRALAARTSVLKTAEDLHIKREKINAILREVAISKAKLVQVEATAAGALISAQSKSFQGFESSRDQLEGLAAAKETQSKRSRTDAGAGVSPAKTGDQKPSFNLNNAIITSAMNIGLTGRSGLEDDSEGQNLDLMGVPKTNVVPESSVQDDQIPPVTVKGTVSSALATGSGPVLPIGATRTDPDKFSPGLATQFDVNTLTDKARVCDFIAIEAGYNAVELADCLVAHFKSLSAFLHTRVTKVRPTSNTVKDQLSIEINLAKITASFCCSTLFQRMMNNPRALASLNCFLPVNRGHFSWVDETSSGHKKPPLLPFPSNLVGRDLLSLFHQFITLINGIDVVFGTSLSLLYKTADEILFLGHPPLLVAKYIDDIRQTVFSTENVGLMWTFQEPIFTQSINSLAASMPSPIPRAAIAGVIPVVVPDAPDIIPRRRLKGKGRQQGNQLDFLAETGQSRVPTLRFRSTDPNQRWYACNDFNDRSGCQYPQSVCKYNHICSACADNSHGLSTHVNFAPKGVAGGDAPK